MCGRFTIFTEVDELIIRYIIENSAVDKYAPKYNAAPMQMIPAVIAGQGGNRLGMLRWGLVPSWSKDPKIGSMMINARAETLTEKPAFNRLLSSRRCIIPANGFYEWKKSGGSKQPYRIVLRDDDVFSFAGLYDIWADANGDKLSTCTIITTEPNALMADIHNRMPVILRREDEAEWLNRDNRDVPALQALLEPYDPSKMRAYPVSAAVGNVRNNYPELLEEVK